MLNTLFTCLQSSNLGGWGAIKSPSANGGLVVFLVQLREKWMEEEQWWQLQPQLLWAGMIPMGISARRA